MVNVTSWIFESSIMVILLKIILRNSYYVNYALRITQYEAYLISGLLFDEERKHDQNYEERASQYTDTTEVALDVGVIGVELGATR